jgi:hypothetical protein
LFIPKRVAKIGIFLFENAGVWKKRNGGGNVFAKATLGELFVRP